MQANERQLWLNLGRKAGLVLGAAALIWGLSAVFLDEPLFRLVALVFLMGGLMNGIFDNGKFPTRRPNLVKGGVTAIFVSLAIWQWIPPKPEAEMEWQPYSLAALQKAAAEGKPVIIDFFAEWCGPCHDLDRRVFGKRKAVSATEHFVRLRADMTRTESLETAAIAERHTIVAYPTVVFIGSNGREAASLRMIGVDSLEGFLKRLRAVR